LGLLQDWLDIGAIGHFIAVVLHLGWTNNAGLLCLLTCTFISLISSGSGLDEQ